MNPISKTEMLVLNATSDDYENLEQICRSLALDFSPENFNFLNSNYFHQRETIDALLLTEVENAIKELVNKGLLEGRTEKGTPIEIPIEPSLVWRGWFRASEIGLRLLKTI